MAITITLDDANDSSVEVFGNASWSAVRGGWADGLPTDTSTMNPEDVLWAVTQAVYALVPFGSTYPNVSSSFFNRLQVQGAGSTRARLRLYYESFSGTPTSIIIDSGATLSTYATNMMPGNNKLIRVYFSGGGGQVAIPDDYPIINMLKPMRRRAVTQLKAGSFDENEADAFEANVGKVNHATWRGRPRGSWLVTAATASVSRYSGYYQTRIEALCNDRETWSYYAIARSKLTGAYAGTSSGLEGQRTILLSQPYTPGEVFARNGMTRVDPYDVVNFTTLFGF